MDKAKTLTHILFPLFLGFIVGGAIADNTSLLIWGIVLLVLDIVVGIVLQYKIENPSKKNDYCNSVSFDKENSQNKFDFIYTRLKTNGGARLVKFIEEDEAGMFLIETCEQMQHAPLYDTLLNLHAVSIEDLNGLSSIVYSFRYMQGSICQNVFIFLVQTNDKNIRFFAVETDFSSFVLCEYSGDLHLNYGQVDLKSIPTRIKEILNS